MPNDKWYLVHGWCVYQNYVQEDPHTGQPDLARHALGQFLDEDKAIAEVKRLQSLDPENVKDYYHEEDSWND